MKNQTPETMAMQLFLDIQRINLYPPETNASFESLKRSAYAAAENLQSLDTEGRWFPRKRLKYWEEVKTQIRKIKP